MNYVVLNFKTYNTQNSPHAYVVVVAGFNDLHSQGVALLATIINSSNTHTKTNIKPLKTEIVIMN